MKAKDLENQFPNKCKKIDDLISYLDNSTSLTPNYSFFLGAGASATSGIATAQELIYDWRNQAYRKYCNDFDVSATVEQQISWLTENQSAWYNAKAEYSSLFENKFSLSKQRMDFIEQQVSSKIPSIGYPYLVKLSEGGYCDVVFTTNFDDLLNESFYQFSTERPIVCAHDSSIKGVSIATKRPKVIKLHGDFLFDAKSTEGETNRLSDNMDRKLREFAKIYGLIIIGYAGGDKSIMRILEDLVDKDEYLQNGLFWCFRSTDDINEEVVNFLKKKGVFYVLIDGFDEIMAEIYGSVCGKGLPFEPRSGSDFAAKIIESYRQNNALRDSKCKVISDHMYKLAEVKNSSAVAEAIQTLHMERTSRKNLKDEEFVKYLQLQKLFRERNYQEALKQIRLMIENCEDKEFRAVLYARLFSVTKSLYRPEESRDAIESWKLIEPDNVFLCMPLADVSDDIEKKLIILERGRDEAPYDEDIAMRYAMELESSFYSIQNNRKTTSEQVVEAYKKAISLQPVLSNPAWRALFDFVIVSAKNSTSDKSDVEWIIDEHLKQDAYSHRTIEIVTEWAKKFSCEKYRENSVEDLISEALLKHYPKNYDVYLLSLKEALIESGDVASIKELILKCEADDRYAKSEDYIYSKVTIMYAVYRDLDGAIDIANKHLRSGNDKSIEKYLIKLYLAKNDIESAKNLLENLKGAITINEFNKLESDIYEASGDYYSAIDALNLSAKVSGKDEDYYANISFLYLKSKDYMKSLDTCKEFLDHHNYSIRYTVVLLNYEFSKMKLGRKASKSRLNDVKSQTTSVEQKSVAMILLGESKEIDEAEKLLKQEIERDFRNLYAYTRWPILEDLNIDFDQIGDDLITSKRTFPEPINKLKESEQIIDI